jgi:hypothetical protein
VEKSPTIEMFLYELAVDEPVRRRAGAKPPSSHLMFEWELPASS